MIKLSRASKASPMRTRLALTCAVSVLAACSQGSSSSNTAADIGDNSLADAPPPASALPLATGPAPAYRPAPLSGALPPAPSAPLGRVPPTDQYAYLNQAYDFSQSLADAPPDYTYDYQGEEPWVWRSPDGYYRVAERLPMGVRYFYYAPGASTPYLVQDPHYSYGYSNGRLTVVYGPGGQVLPYAVQARQAHDAGVYLAWAAGLYAAARREPHVAVSQSRWALERQAVYADQTRWRAAQSRNPAWATYSQAHQDDQAHWADQRYVRAAEAARFAQTVHDPTALAHAQTAAKDARDVAQNHGEQPPGPAPAAGIDPRQAGHPAVARPGLTTAHDDRDRLQPGPEAKQARDQTPRQTEPRDVAPSAAQAHASPAPEPHAAGRPLQPPADARRAVPERSEGDSRPAPTAQARAPARDIRQAPAIEAPRPPEPPAHAPAPHPAPSPPKPPATAKPKPKPDEPHP